MSPRISPRFYVIRLAWLGRRIVPSPLSLVPRPAQERAFRGRRTRPSYGRSRS